MQIINQYSAIWMTALLVAIAGILLLRRSSKWPKWLVFGTLVVGLVTVWTMLRPRQTTLELDAVQVQANIGQGTPVLLEFQSPY